jgi:hypothetical protein
LPRLRRVRSAQDGDGDDYGDEDGEGGAAPSPFASGALPFSDGLLSGSFDAAKFAAMCTLGGAMPIVQTGAPAADALTPTTTE